MTKPARLFAIVLLYCSLLLFGTAQAAPPPQEATATITYTPIPTRTPTPVISTTTILPDGSGALFTNSWTAEGRAIFDALLMLAALLALRFFYDLAKQWYR